MRKLLKIVLFGLGLCVIALAAMIRTDIPLDELRSEYGFGGSHYVTHDGALVHYVDAGIPSGETLVLVHGSNGSVHNWTGWIEDLGRDYRIIAMDLPSHGLSGNSVSEFYDDARMHQVMDAVLDDAEVGQFILAGNSWGGSIAASYAIAHPDRLSHLVLVDTAGFGRADQSGEQPLAFRLLRLPLVGNLMAILTPRFLIDWTVKTAYGDPDRLSERTLARYSDLLRGAGHRAATLRRMTSYTPPVAALDFSEVSVPTLIIWGSLDTWIQPAAAFSIHEEIPDSMLVIFDELGHLPMEEGPAETADVVREFLGLK